MSHMNPLPESSGSALSLEGILLLFIAFILLFILAFWLGVRSGKKDDVEVKKSREEQKPQEDDGSKIY